MYATTGKVYRTDATHGLDENDRSTLRNGLQVAAERFDEHVKEFTAIAETLGNGERVAFWADPSPQSIEAARRMAAQFQQQADDSRRLASLIADADAMSVFAPDHEPEEG